MTKPLFLLGAGFNRDAKKEAGTIRTSLGDIVECDYPLLEDLKEKCFSKESYSENISVEQNFANALKQGIKLIDVLLHI